MRPKPILGITAGDPAGIGPEVMRRALELWAEEPLAEAVECRVIGSLEPQQPGQPSSATARAAWETLEEATQLALSGAVEAIVTGPVGKHQLRQIGFPFPGQTEFLAHRAGVEEFLMAFTGGRLTLGLVTIHVPLREVPALITPNAIVCAGRLLAGFLQELGHPRPRIAVAGLNPHAGEQGECGREEIELITPAIARLQACVHGAEFSGPWSPDSVFVQALAGEFEAVLCHYHDQGLIPFKLHAFEEGVNCTVGLPFIRTSPDHGTAYALAGKNAASPRSALAALRVAARLAVQRQQGAAASTAS